MVLFFFNDIITDFAFVSILKIYNASLMRDESKGGENVSVYR